MEKSFCKKIQDKKNSKQKLHHQMVEAEAIHNLALPHPGLKHQCGVFQPFCTVCNLNL